MAHTSLQSDVYGPEQGALQILPDHMFSTRRRVAAGECAQRICVAKRHDVRVFLRDLHRRSCLDEPEQKMQGLSCLAQGVHEKFDREFLKSSLPIRLARLKCASRCLCATT
jgi:hypothetical protein